MATGLADKELLIETDRFLSMPYKAQLLYLNLSARHLNDWAMCDIRTVAFLIGANSGDIETLVEDGFLFYSKRRKTFDTAGLKALGGGDGYYIRTTKAYQIFRNKVIKRDKCCQMCGGTNNLEVHHIKPISRYPELGTDIKNGILLCRSCHMKAHASIGEEYMKPINRVVSTSFWEDETIVNDFSPEDKYFYLYLITNPHTTQLGIYKLVPKTAAFELGYSKEAVMVLLERFESKYGMIRYNKETCEVAIKNYLRHSVVKGGKPVMDCLLKEEDRVEDKTLLEYIYVNNKDKDKLNITVKEYIYHLSKLFNNNVNDNDNDNERIVHESSTNRTTNRQSSKYDAIVDAWNSLTDVGVNPVRNINTGSKRADCLRARIREYGESAILEAIENVRTSDFLQGKNNRGWIITFDWFVLPSNFPKVLEGNYNKRSAKTDSNAYEMPTGLEKPQTVRQG